MTCSETLTHNDGLSQEAIAKTAQEVPNLKVMGLLLVWLVLVNRMQDTLESFSLIHLGSHTLRRLQAFRSVCIACKTR